MRSQSTLAEANHLGFSRSLSMMQLSAWISLVAS